MTNTPFTGFRPAGFAWLRELAAQQNKPWFEANRATYETELKTPAAALVEAVAADYAKRGWALTGDAKKSTFRIHRDVRFSKDKSPYKTHIGLVWTRTGSKKSSGLAYLHVADEGCFFAAGFYADEKPIVDALRNDIRFEAERFKAAMASATAGGLALDTSETLTRAPRGFEDVTDPALLPAIKMKNLVITRPIAKADMATAALVGTIIDATAAAMPLLEFGWAAIEAVVPDWAKLDPAKTPGG